MLTNTFLTLSLAIIGDYMTTKILNGKAKEIDMFWVVVFFVFSITLFLKIE